MYISNILTIRKFAMAVANRTERWNVLASSTGLSIATLEDLFLRSGIIDMSGELIQFTSYQDIMFTICLYFSMKPTANFKKTVY